jgi:hypothetical protein
MKLARKVVLFAALNAAVGWAPALAFAFPPMTNEYPGSECRSAGTAGTDDWFSQVGQGANGFRNTDSASHYAICPIARDYVEASDLAMASTYITEASVVVDGGTTCQLLVEVWTGEWSTIYSPNVTDSYLGQLKRQRFGAGSSWIGVGQRSVASLYCYVPAGGTILNYKVTEDYTGS